MQKRKGFTLIELIVVIAILGILALFLVPSFIGYASDAKESICNTNLTSIQRAYQFQLAKQESDENKSLLIQVMDNKFNDFSTIPSCPSGGIYTVINDGSEGAAAFKVVCSEHSNALGKIPTQIMNQMKYFTEYVKDLDVNSPEFDKYYELYKKLYKDKPDMIKDKKGFKTNILNNNSELRNYLKYINGGTWPTMEVNGEKYYVQPYIDLSTINGRVPSKDIVIYASVVDGNNWYTNYIYDSNTGKWWTGKNRFSIDSKSFSEVKDLMVKNGWKVVENSQDLVISGQINMP